jgi:diadenylate cyclase
MPQLIASIVNQIALNSLIDIGITALLIYWLFSLIRGTRAVSLVIGVSVLFAVYAAARAFDLRLLTQILQTLAVVGLFALVVVFQPELRRALERIGRVGSFNWLLSPGDSRSVEHVADEVARAATLLSSDGHGALIVLERDTGLEEVAETGVMLHADVTADLLRTIFAPKTPLHDGAVVVREDTIVAAGALLPLAEMTVHTERFGTRHRAALGITEQTDAVVVVVSEENSQVSLVERARIVRNLSEPQLAKAIRALLAPDRARTRFGRPFAGDRQPGRGGRAPILSDLGRFVPSRVTRNGRHRAEEAARPEPRSVPAASSAASSTASSLASPAGATPRTSAARPAPVSTGPSRAVEPGADIEQGLAATGDGATAPDGLSAPAADDATAAAVRSPR